MSALALKADMTIALRRDYGVRALRPSPRGRSTAYCRPLMQRRAKLISNSEQRRMGTHINVRKDTLATSRVR